MLRFFPSQVFNSHGGFMAKSGKKRRQDPAGGDETSTGGATGDTGSGQQTGQGGIEAAKDAESLLRADHRKVERLFREFKAEGKSKDQKRQLAREACNELILHGMVEEEIFYSACRDKQVEDQMLDEAQVEHDSLKLLIADVQGQEPDSPYYDAKVTVLSEYVEHHVKEEEKPFSGIFAKARKAGVDLDDVGRRIHARKQALLPQIESGSLQVPAPRSLQGGQGRSERNSQEIPMARQFESDRDDWGRDGDDERGWAQGPFSRGRDEQQGGRYGSQRGSSPERFNRGESGQGGSDQGGYRQSGYGQGRSGQGGYGQGGYSQQGGASQNRGMGGSRDWYEPEPGRGSYGRSRDEFGTGGRGYTGGGSGYTSGGGGYSGGGGHTGNDDFVGGLDRGQGSSRGRYGSEDAGGRSGGFGSFERESEDYERGMGSRDRGRVAGGRTGRDDDYTALGRGSRFGNDQDPYYGRRSSEEDDGSNGGRGRASNRQRGDYGRGRGENDQGGWRNRE